MRKFERVLGTEAAAEAGDGEGRDAATERENGREEGRKGGEEGLVSWPRGRRKESVDLSPAWLREIFYLRAFYRKAPRPRLVVGFYWLWRCARRPAPVRRASGPSRQSKPTLREKMGRFVESLESNYFAGTNSNSKSKKTNSNSISKRLFISLEIKILIKNYPPRLFNWIFKYRPSLFRISR
jgi:hypothetical protein